MALVMNDPESARRWQTVRLAGMKNQDEKLWNGEYYIQIPEPRPARDYDTGCHADQLLGQWWAHMLDLGYLYPAARVKSGAEGGHEAQLPREVRRLQADAAPLHPGRRGRA